MPPTRLKVFCLECPHKENGFFPKVLIKADKHADKMGHEMTAFTGRGYFYCNIHPANKKMPGE